MPSPEELAREKIDKLLADCDWIIQNRSAINLSAGRGIAIREGLLKGGEADYLLFGDGKALGTVEAKPEGYTLIGVEEQSGKYAKSLLDIYPKWGEPLPFAYESRREPSRDPQPGRPSLPVYRINPNIRRHPNDSAETPTLGTD